MQSEVDNNFHSAKDDLTLRNNIIAEYKPFILNIACKSVNKYLEYGRDEELSIALIAFNEAIDSFDISKGHFLPLASRIINLRLIDYLRKIYKEPDKVPISFEIGDKTIDNSKDQSLKLYEDSIVSEYRRLEIKEYVLELAKYNLCLKDLEKHSPKHTQTKYIVDNVIKIIIDKPKYIENIKTKNIVNFKEISTMLEVPVKKIERFRKYIIGVVILKTGRYEYLNSFVNWGG